MAFYLVGQDDPAVYMRAAIEHGGSKTKPPEGGVLLCC